MTDPGSGQASSALPGPPAVDAAEFRRLMARWATGVSVVTSAENGRDHGLTVNALLSVSLSPPSLLVSLMYDADSTPVIRRTGRFAVSVLAHDQRELSERFARVAQPEDKFRGLAVRRGGTGLPLLPDPVVAFECRVTKTVEVADHVLVVGEVEAVHAGRDVLPLVFYRGRYAEAELPQRLKLPSPRA